jgi:hypothetical protein
VAYRTCAFDNLKRRVGYTCVLRHPMKCDGRRHFLSTFAFTGPDGKPDDASGYRTYRCSRRGRTAELVARPTPAFLDHQPPLRTSCGEALRLLLQPSRVALRAAGCPAPHRSASGLRRSSSAEDPCSSAALSLKWHTGRCPPSPARRFRAHRVRSCRRGVDVTFAMEPENGLFKRY